MTLGRPGDRCRCVGSPGGAWAAFWNHVADPAFHRTLDDVCRRFAPPFEERRSGDDEELEQVAATALAVTGSFHPVEA